MRIAVLRGGPSRHYEESLQTGGHVLSVLHKDPESFRPIDVFISKGGEWHVGGIVVQPEKALRHVDLAWNALHGEYGDDGHVAQYLNKVGIPHTGSGTLGLALANNKDQAKILFMQHGLETPMHVVLSSLDPQKLTDIFRTYMHPVIVKPTFGRASHGVVRAHTYLELVDALEGALRHSDRVLVEELIRGDVVSCGVIEDFRGEALYSLIPTPSKFKNTVNKAIEGLAKLAHSALGLRHYSFSDFIVTRKGKIYILETNPLPALHDKSLWQRSLKSVGATPEEFVRHVISMS